MEFAPNRQVSSVASLRAVCPIGLGRPLFNRVEVKEELGVSPEWPCALPIVVGWPDGETPPTSRRPAQIVTWR